MGTSYGNFVKYPRTPHLFGSKGTSDDKHMDARQSETFIAHPSLIIEEKIDGTNVGIHFHGDQLILQCRGHLITEGMHPQYDLFKQWATVKRNTLEPMLGERYILFGEWAYARHSVFYRQLPHYFFEFDIYDKSTRSFLTLNRRLEMLAGTGIETVPVLQLGPVTQKQLGDFIGVSAFDSVFENPFTGQTDNRMEGIYLRVESENAVTGRAKMVRPEFVEKIKQSTHWQQQVMVPNQLSAGVDLWR